MVELKDIERNIIKGARNHLWSPFTKAIKQYQLLKPNDKVCICISGGKDSMLMAKLFQELVKHSDFPFEVKYLVMNPGYNQANIDLIKHNLEILNIPATIVETDIFEIATKQEKNPCYLCARMRRGALYRFAKENGCNKIALGHHYDDVIETTLMSILNTGSFETMLPKLHSENYPGMEVIRPLYLLREKDIISWAKRNELTFLNCACKFTEEVHSDKTSSKRLETKMLIKQLEKQNPIIIKNLFKVTENVNLNKVLGYKKDDEYHYFLDDYENGKTA